MLTRLRSATINFPYLQASRSTFLTPKGFVVIKTNWPSLVLNQAVKQSDLGTIFYFYCVEQMKILTAHSVTLKIFRIF